MRKKTILLIIFLIFWKKKKIINEIANKSILEKIYPSGETLKEIAANYVIKKYPELFVDWNDKRWTFYYNSTIQAKVSFIELHYNFKYPNN